MILLFSSAGSNERGFMWALVRGQGYQCPHEGTAKTMHLCVLNAAAFLVVLRKLSTLIPRNV